MKTTTQVSSYAEHLVKRYPMVATSDPVEIVDLAYKAGILEGMKEGLKRLKRLEHDK